MTQYTARLTGAVPFNLQETFECGQCFRWLPGDDGSYTGVVGRNVITLRADGDDLLVAGLDQAEAEQRLIPYLALDEDYAAIQEQFRRNTQLAQAVDYARGIRVLRQDRWEALCSFIISQNNNIPRIRRTVEAMCERLGEPRQGPAGTYYTFPDPADLKDVRRLQGLGLGYRDKYIAQLARNVASGRVKLSKLHTMTTEEAHTYLKSIYGIGEKVSNCILLFGLGRKEAFPVDTWMRKIIGREYGGKFPVELYPETAGVMQQYMFFSERDRKSVV